MTTLTSRIVAALLAGLLLLGSAACTARVEGNGEGDGAGIEAEIEGEGGGEGEGEGDGG